jgi:AcrR family transcriptional regulator
MSRAGAAPLAARHADLTQRAILDGAVGLLQEGSLEDVTMRAVAARAGMSERTVFRYFAMRDDLLEAMAGEIARRFDLPPDPGTVEELLAYPASLYARFDATAALTRAALRSEYFDRFRSTVAQTRWRAVQEIVDRAGAARPVRERRIAGANIRYHLSASAWRYYRDYFGFPLDEAVECARTAIAQSLEGLGVRLSRGRRSRP